MVLGDIAVRMQESRQEIKRGTNVVLQMTPPLMPLSCTFNTTTFLCLSLSLSPCFLSGDKLQS